MKRTLFFLALAICTVQIHGQTRQAIIRVTPFTGSGMGLSEASMLERLVASYIVELKSFRVIDAQGQDMALLETESALSAGMATTTSAPLAADYIVGGSIGKIGEIYVFTLENTRVASGEKLSVSDTALSISDIVLRARNLTRSLFGVREASLPASPATGSVAGSQAPAPADSSGKAEPATTRAAVYTAPSPAVLAGSWKGDKGLETVRLFPNATGLAVLSGGGTLKVRVSVSADTIFIDQDQPNDVALYRSPTVTLDMARKIAAQARPMRWIFTLSPDGKYLNGIKASVAVSGSGSSLTIDNNYEREALWSRISR